MTIFARGVAKTVAIATETTFGTQSAASGQLLRRTSSDLNLNIQDIQSQEILPSQQIRDDRQGPRQVQGTISGQLSCLTYNMMLEGLLRGTFTAGTTLGPITDGTSTIDGNGNLVLTSASLFNFSTAFKLGDMVRVTGLTSTYSTENGEDFRVIAVAPTTATLAKPFAFTAWASGQNETVAMTGKKLITPATGQLDRSFSLEHWYSDVSKSELFTGCKVTQVSLNVPASGFVTFQASITGQNALESGTQVYASAAAATSTTGLTAVSGLISYKGVALSYITSLNLTIASQVDAPPVVGSNLTPAIFLGTLSARGSLTALMTNDTMTADFLNETEVTLSLLMTDSPLPTANFMSVTLPRVKLISSSKTDSDRAITRSYSFMALENAGQYPLADLTTVAIQDSLA